MARSTPVRETMQVPPHESTLEMLARIISGVVAGCALIAVVLSSVWVATDEQSSGSWVPVLPWALIAVVSLLIFGVLLMRSRARHASRA